MIVFSNTTPIIALSSIQRLDLLPHVFGRIHLVKEVVDECEAGGTIAVPSLREFDWLTIIESTPISNPSLFLELDKGEKHTLDMAQKYQQDYWRIFQRKLDTLKADSPATTETRNLWMVPLLGLLGYQLEYQAKAVELNGKTYAISHRVVNRGNTPLHIIGYREAAGLDRENRNAPISAHHACRHMDWCRNISTCMMNCTDWLPTAGCYVCCATARA